MKRSIAILALLALVIITTTSLAQADFYVIAAGKPAVRTVLVSPKATASESGTALLNALAGITDASATKPHLLIIEPGIYDVGTSSVQMKAYVDIQGSGENVTTIQGSMDSNAAGVVNGVSLAELRSLAVKHTGGGATGVAIYNNASSPAITQVTALVSGVTSFGYAVFNDSSSPIMTQVSASASGATYLNEAVYNYVSTATMTQVTATASGTATFTYGVENYYSAPTMTLVTANATGGSYAYAVVNNCSSATMAQAMATASGATNTNYGVYNMGDLASYKVRIDHSVISGSSASVWTNVTCLIGNTRLEGGAVGGGGTNTCAGVYDENYTFYPSTCP